MSLVNFDLQPDWLRRHETTVTWAVEAGAKFPGFDPGRRSFKVAVGGEDFLLSVRHVPKTSAEAFSAPAEDPRPPTDGELLFLIARAFLGSLPQHPPAEPDVEKGWDAYRRQMQEVLPASNRLGEWDEVPSELREAFACGIRAASGPSAISHPPSTISEKP